jgi:hypothetical protein
MQIFAKRLNLHANHVTDARSAKILNAAAVCNAKVFVERKALEPLLISRMPVARDVHATQGVRELLAINDARLHFVLAELQLVVLDHENAGNRRACGVYNAQLYD